MQGRSAGAREIGFSDRQPRGGGRCSYRKTACMPSSRGVLGRGSGAPLLHGVRQLGAIGPTFGAGPIRSRCMRSALTGTSTENAYGWGFVARPPRRGEVRWARGSAGADRSGTATQAKNALQQLNPDFGTMDLTRLYNLTTPELRTEAERGGRERHLRHEPWAS